METTPFLRIVFIIPNSEELSSAEQPEIKNNIVRIPAINIGILRLYRKNVFRLPSTQKKQKIIMCCMVAVSHSPQGKAFGNSGFLHRWQRCTAMIHHKRFQTAHGLLQIRIISSAQVRCQVTVANRRMRITVFNKLCVFCLFKYLISFADCYKTLFVFITFIELCAQSVFV